MTDRIELGHGSGGRMMNRLIGELVDRYLTNPLLSPMGDAAEVPVGAGRLAFSTDSFTVTPPDFPGGDIGKLAICGTVNDVAVQGGDPWFMSLALILEEGLLREDLERYMASARAVCDEAGVLIVTGDTKVVPRGGADRLFVITTGLGPIPAAVHLGAEWIRPGDQILVSGPVGDHEAAIVTARGEFGLTSSVISDCAPLNQATHRLRDAVPGLRVMRDATRGGLASVLDELAQGSGLCFTLDEDSVPVREEVRGLAEMLGFDPLYMACEGRFVAVVAAEDLEPALELLRKQPYCGEATRIGQVSEERSGVLLRTELGGLRPLIRLEGSQLPRIC